MRSKPIHLLFVEYLPYVRTSPGPAFLSILLILTSSPGVHQDLILHLRKLRLHEVEFLVQFLADKNSVNSSITPAPRAPNVFPVFAELLCICGALLTESPAVV